MIVTSAIDEREFRMSRLPNAIKEDLLFFFRTLRLRFTKRLVFRNTRLQVEGSRGQDIVKFQNRFNQFAARYGISIPLSGVYDEQTQRGVRDFQCRALYVLHSDGFVGPVTASALHIKLLGE